MYHLLRHINYEAKLEPLTSNDREPIHTGSHEVASPQTPKLDPAVAVVSTRHQPTPSGLANSKNQGPRQIRDRGNAPSPREPVWAADV